EDSDPQVSPDGKLVAFISDRSGNRDIWTVAIEGGEPKRITTGSVDENTPRWSPDGATLVFVAQRPGLQSLVAVAASGGEPRQLLNWTSGNQFQPEWSRDGKSIAFVSDRESATGGDLWIMSAAGG